MEQDKTLLTDQPGRAAPPGKSPGRSILKGWRLFAPLNHIRRVSNSNKKMLKQLNKRISRLLASQDGESRRLQRCLEIAAQCQKQTAEYANLTIERHALHPAIETVFLLNNELQELARQTAQAAAGQSQCQIASSLVNSVTEVAKIANEKCACLGIRTICPAPMDEFDASECDISQATPTVDRAKHKKVNRTLCAGLSYRGKVLQRARVSLFKYSETHQTNRKELS